jgi:hypothetical protein
MYTAYCHAGDWVVVDAWKRYVCDCGDEEAARIQARLLNIAHHIYG